MSSLLSRICLLSKEAFRLFRPSREYFVFAFFLLLSGVIWLAVSLNDYYEREMVIPVLITDIPKTVAMNDGAEDTIRVTVRDKGYSFINYIYGGEIGTIKLKFDTYKRKSGTLAVNSAELKKNILRVLENTATVTSIKPDKLEYSYSYGVSKVVPIRLAGCIEPAEAYYIAQTQIIPDHVTIYVSKSIADSVKYVTTEELNITNFSDSVNINARLKPMRGVNFSQNTVNVRLLADILTEEEVEVPVTAVNVPEGVSLRFFPSRVKVKYVVGVSLTNEISSSGFIVQADYKDITPGTDKCKIQLVKRPHAVMRASTVVKQIDYLIEN